jgi:ABC-type phosphate transport system ATPase subunit
MTDEDLLQCIQETTEMRKDLAIYQKACKMQLTRIVNASIQKKARETERHKKIAQAAYKALKKQKAAGEVSQSNFHLAYN